MIDQMFINNFVLAMVAIDPISIAPIFLALTHGVAEADKRKIALQAIITATFILLFFWLFGSSFLEVMGVSIDSFRIIGGLFLIAIAYDMVFAKRSERREQIANKQLNKQDISSLASFPLALPLIAGPAAMALCVLLGQHIDYSQSDLYYYGVISWQFMPILLVLFLTYIAMLLSSFLVRFISEVIMLTIQRIFGLILGTLAIEYVIAGVKNIFIL